MNQRLISDRVIQAAPPDTLWEPPASTTPWWPPSSPSWPARRNSEARNPPTRPGESPTSPQKCSDTAQLHSPACVVYHFPSRAYRCGHAICSVVDHWLMRTIGPEEEIIQSCFDVQAAKKNCVNCYIALKVNLFVLDDDQQWTFTNAPSIFACFKIKKSKLFFILTGIWRPLCGRCFVESRCASVSPESSSPPTSRTRSLQVLSQVSMCLCPPCYDNRSCLIILFLVIFFKLLQLQRCSILADAN